VPKAYSAPQQTALAAAHHAECHLIEFAFTSGVQRFATSGAPIAASSFDPGSRGTAWQGGFDPSSIGVIRETDLPEAVGLRITVSGVSSSQRALALSEPVQGRRLSIWLCQFDPANYTVIGTPVLEWEGMLDVVYPQDRDDGGGLIQSIIIEAESEDARFLRAQMRRYTDRDHQQRFPGDRFFEFSPQVNKTLIWPAAAYFRR
jgi:hypothetical protein